MREKQIIVPLVQHMKVHKNSLRASQTLVCPKKVVLGVNTTLYNCFAWRGIPWAVVVFSFSMLSDIDVLKSIVISLLSGFLFLMLKTWSRLPNNNMIWVSYVI